MPAEVERDGLGAVPPDPPVGRAGGESVGPPRSPRGDDTPKGARTVLIVDDSGYARQRLRRFLEAEGWPNVTEAADGDEALRRYQDERPALVLIDQVMRGRAGIDTARLLLERDPAARILLHTVVSDPEIHRCALQAGILHVLRKNDWKGLRDVLEPERR